MADESDPLQDLTEQVSRLAARDLVSTLLIKYLMGEIAVINRSPPQASAFTAGLRQNLENFAKFANDGGTEMDLKFEREMRSYIDLLFSGITFDSGSKS